MTITIYLQTTDFQLISGPDLGEGSTMKQAALYVHGRVVVGFNHGDAFGKLTENEKDEEIVSGFFDSETEEFDGGVATEHFFDKEILLIRHATVEDKPPDPNLTPIGVEQAQQVACTLSRFDLSEYTAIVSPFLRCLQMANILQQILQIKFHVDPMVAENPNFVQESGNIRIKNRHDAYPQFSWETEDDILLRSEPPQDFLERTLFVLRHLPHKAILVTHQGFICNIARLALCDEKAMVFLRRGVPPASVTYIHQQEVEALESYETKHQDRPPAPH